MLTEQEIIAKKAELMEALQKNVTAFQQAEHEEKRINEQKRILFSQNAELRGALAALNVVLPDQADGKTDTELE